MALDDSPRATSVFDAAARYARSLGAQLYVIRTIAIPPHFPPISGNPEDDPVPRRLSEIAKHDLDSIARRVLDISVAETLITFGSPAQMIIEAAEKLRVDLIVLGSHGHSGSKRVLGTTAAAIANRSTCDVLVVRSGITDGKQELEDSLQ